MSGQIDGYLLDTNILPAWLRGHESVIKRIQTLGDAPLRISSVTLGEIEFGHWAESPGGPTPVQQEFKAFVSERFPGQIRVLNIDRHTAVPYGQLKAALFEKFTRKDGKRARRLHQLTNPDDLGPLGIQENDVWIAAQAMQYNLILVTDDAMRKIKSVASGLIVENWLKDPSCE